MVCLIMITYQVVDSFDKRAQSLAVVLFFQEEILLGEYLDQIHQAVTPFFAERLRVRGKVRKNGDDALVDWF